MGCHIFNYFLTYYSIKLLHIRRNHWREKNAPWDNEIDIFILVDSFSHSNASHTRHYNINFISFKIKIVISKNCIVHCVWKRYMIWSMCQWFSGQFDKLKFTYWQSMCGCWVRKMLKMYPFKCWVNFRTKFTFIQREE